MTIPKADTSEVTDDLPETETGQEALSKDFAGYMTRNWTHEQIVEFCLKLLGEEAVAWWARKQEHQE